MSGAISASSKFDVIVEKFELEENPASLKIYLRAGSDLTFFSKITYENIQSWKEVWGEDLALKERLLGAVIAWDSMRFLALGGTKLKLPDNVSCSAEVSGLWTEAFINQFGEWRFRNLIQYIGTGPKLEASNSGKAASNSGNVSQIGTRVLLTNGGGKDTLASFLLLKDSGINCDIYQGYLPLGGKAGKQKELLDGLSDEFIKEEQKLIEVRIEDNFFNRDPLEFANAGVEVKYFLSDFAVGHTANYAGYLPIILALGYQQIFFNIERSADTPMAQWKGEPINHQWIKSSEYQKLSNKLFEIITGATTFKGFGSTLRGLYDLSIYKLLKEDSKLLLKTHSCNYGKPWCRKCAKCCFCYLMMSAYFGEALAMEVTETSKSLFEDKECLPAWESLLDRNQVAWDCVPSHEECLVAVSYCLKSGIKYPLLEKWKASEEAVMECEHKYTQIAWQDIPENLHVAVKRRLIT